MSGRSMIECEGCGEMIPLGEAHVHEFFDGVLCEECYLDCCSAEDQGRAA